MKEKRLRRILPKTLWGDRLYGIHRFYKRLGRLPEKHPVRFNDHLFVLKTSGSLYDPLIQFLTDKEHAKLYIAAALGEEFVTETYRVLRSKEEVDSFRPDRFPCILKPTHSSGQVMPCVDPSTPLDREVLRKWFDIDYYERSREHNYRYLSPKIIVEEFFSEDGQKLPDDYKFFCFSGVPGFIQVDSDRYTGHKRDLYDTSWNRIDVRYVYPNRKQEVSKPALLENMLHAARKVSAGFPFVRVDFFATSTEIRVGELTFCPESGSGNLAPPEAEFAFGKYFGEFS